jgi:hypothetical protein
MNAVDLIWLALGWWFTLGALLVTISIRMGRACVNGKFFVLRNYLLENSVVIGCFLPFGVILGPLTFLLILVWLQMQWQERNLLESDPGL